MIQGKRFVASFAIATYGDAKAKQLALQERERQLAAMHGSAQNSAY